MARKLIFAPLLIAVLFSVTGCSKKEQHNMSNEIDENLPPIVSFCSSIDYSDTASLHTDGEMAEHMATIVKHMTRSDSTDISRALEIFFKGLGSDGVSLRSAARHANLYLYNPASPVRDETLYILFLKSLLNNSGIPTDISDKAKEQLHWAMLNRPGTIATDFRYIDRDGNQGTLHSLSSRQTMLVFYDPECPH
ncbi:MAG: DUF5106 domain-containing protein, partial [Muribaculaceae bacterium]|nr:DUF5106 domain-containing protein [Muribaculaceae bacterium]